MFIIETTNTQKGLGLFSGSDIKSGTFVFAYCYFSDSGVTQLDSLIYRPFSRPNTSFVETIYGRYLNHDNDSNLSAKKEDNSIKLFTNRDIILFDELTVNYKELSELVGFNFSTYTNEIPPINLKNIFNIR